MNEIIQKNQQVIKTQKKIICMRKKKEEIMKKTKSDQDNVRLYQGRHTNKLIL